MDCLNPAAMDGIPTTIHIEPTRLYVNRSGKIIKNTDKYKYYTHSKRSSRHPGMDSRQAILPAALRVNANLFQTDLCRDPVYKDVLIYIA